MTIDEAEVKQNEFLEQLDELRAYPTRRSEYTDLKENACINLKDWGKNVYGFKNEIL